jgi:hypothetical protein
MGSLSLRPGDSLTVPRTALSAGFIRFVSSTNATQATGFRLFPRWDSPPTEHASLSLVALWSKKSCGSGVGLEQTAETLLADNPLVGRRCVRRGREEQQIMLPLMVSLAVIQLSNATPILVMCVKFTIAFIPGMAEQYGCMRAS